MNVQEVLQLKDAMLSREPHYEKINELSGSDMALAWVAALRELIELEQIDELQGWQLKKLAGQKALEIKQQRQKNVRNR